MNFHYFCNLLYIFLFGAPGLSFSSEKVVQLREYVSGVNCNEDVVFVVGFFICSSVYIMHSIMPFIFYF